MRKITLVALVMIIVFLLSGTCLADEKLVTISSAQEAIDKFFAGRTLDPLEGIWVLDAGCEIVIVKASLIDTKNPKCQSCDYLGFYSAGKFAGVLYAGFTKTRYSNVFSGLRGYNTPNGVCWKLLTPTVLQFDGRAFAMDVWATQSLVRIYPAP